MAFDEAHQFGIVSNAVIRGWRKLTGAAPQPGVAFAEAGGDSLGVMELLFMTERVLGRRLPADCFHCGMTAAEFVDRALNTPASANRTGTVFLCPASHGQSAHLADLIGLCGDAVSFMPVGYPDWRTCVAPHFELTTIVDAVLAEVQTRSPSGPVRLAGYSMGGLVAYEVAASLEADGRDVAFLGLLDAPAPGAPGPAPLQRPEAPDRIRAWWWAFQRNRRQPTRATMLWRLGWLTAALAAVPVSASLLRSMARQPGLRPRWAWMARYQDWTAHHLAERLRIAACRRAASWQRDRPRLRCRTVLFRSAYQHAKAAPDLGWSRLIDDLVVMDVPGDHLSLVTLPHVRETAAAFVQAQGQVRAEPRMLAGVR